MLIIWQMLFQRVFAQADALALTHLSHVQCGGEAQAKGRFMTATDLFFRCHYHLS